MDAMQPVETGSTSDLTSDDYLTALKAIRDAIVADLGQCESMRDKAAFYARLESVLKLIDTATPEEEKAGDPIDEIAARRTARGGATSRLGHTTRSS